MTTTASPTVLEPPIPRGRWLKRGAIAITSLATVAIALRLIAGFVVERRANAYHASLVAEGLPVHLVDIQQPALPDAENALVLWQQAFAVVDRNVDSPRTSPFDWEDLGRFPPYKAKWHELADASETATAPAFAIADRARRLPRATWGMDYSQPNATLYTTGLNQARDLANRLADSFEHLHLRGDDTAVVDRLLACLALADAVRSEPTLIRQLVGDGIDAMACHALRSHVGSLRVGDRKGDASPEQVRALIDRLLHNTSATQFPRAIAAESILGPEMITRVLTQEWVVRPVLRRELQAARERWIDLARQAQPEGRGALLTRAIAAEPPPRPRGVDPDAFDGVARLRQVFLLDDASRGGTRSLQMNNLVMAGRRIAAIAMAMRWHQLDHGGRLPATLDALVPDYLPALPTNPMSPRDAAFEFVVLRGTLPDGGDRPMLFVEMPDGHRPASPSSVPAYELSFTAYNAARQIDRSNGRWSDLTNWTPTAAQMDADNAERQRR